MLGCWRFTARCDEGENEAKRTETAIMKKDEQQQKMEEMDRITANNGLCYVVVVVSL